MEQKSLSSRSGAVDLTKALAICAVLLIHSSANSLAALEVGVGPWLASAFYGGVGRWAVPAFLLCSGALMNDPGRELSLKKLFSKYVPRLALALCVWTAFYECLRIYGKWGAAPLSEMLLEAAKNCLHGDTYYHLYYFFFVFALYLALPLTRLLARAPEAELRYILALWLFLGVVVRFLQYFWPVSRMAGFLHYYSMPETVVCLGLGLLGFWLRQHPPKSWLPPLLLLLISFAVVFTGTWRRSAAAGVLDQFYFDAFGLFPVLMAVGVFRLAQWGMDGRAVPRWVRFLSAGSFCVYLVHPFFQLVVNQHVVDFNLLSPVWAVPAQSALLLLLSLAAYLVLRRIPWVKSWII